MMKLFLLFLLPILCYSADTSSVSQELVVYASMTAIYGVSKSDLSIGKKSIQDAGGQPCFMLRFVPSTTYYYWVWITTNAKSDNTFLNSSNVKKCYRRISVRSLMETLGVVTDKVTVLMGYPPNMSYYEVHESTP